MATSKAKAKVTNNDAEMCALRAQIEELEEANAQLKDELEDAQREARDRGPEFDVFELQRTVESLQRSLRCSEEEEKRSERRFAEAEGKIDGIKLVFAFAQNIAAALGKEGVSPKVVSAMSDALRY